MRAWYFTEMPYPHLPPLDSISTMRVTLPNKHFDPRIGRISTIAISTSTSSLMRPGST